MVLHLVHLLAKSLGTSCRAATVEYLGLRNRAIATTSRQRFQPATPCCIPRCGIAHWPVSAGAGEWWWGCLPLLSPPAPAPCVGLPPPGLDPKQLAWQSWSHSREKSCHRIGRCRPPAPRVLPGIATGQWSPVPA